MVEATASNDVADVFIPVERDDVVAFSVTTIQDAIVLAITGSHNKYKDKTHRNRMLTDNRYCRLLQKQVETHGSFTAVQTLVQELM